jgi:hypothetical protein
VLFNQAAPTPKPLLASGNWRARRVLGYDTKGLGSYGMIQPAILTLRGDFDNLVEGAAHADIASRRSRDSAKLAGSTGRHEMRVRLRSRPGAYGGIHFEQADLDSRAIGRVAARVAARKAED